MEEAVTILQRKHSNEGWHLLVGVTLVKGDMDLELQQLDCRVLRFGGLVGFPCVAKVELSYNV